MDQDGEEENEENEENDGVATESNPCETGEGEMFVVDVGGTQYYTNDAYNGQIYESILETQENTNNKSNAKSATSRGRRKVVICERRRVGRLVGKFRKGNAIFRL